jgi:hypothetical protein
MPGNAEGITAAIRDERYSWSREKGNASCNPQYSTVVFCSFLRDMSQ